MLHRAPVANQHMPAADGAAGDLHRHAEPVGHDGEHMLDGLE